MKRNITPNRDEILDTIDNIHEEAPNLLARPTALNKEQVRAMLDEGSRLLASSNRLN
jgi:hypothetical protein